MKQLIIINYIQGDKMTDNNLDINDIQDKDGDWLTGILEPYADDIYDEIMLLNITKKVEYALIAIRHIKNSKENRLHSSKEIANRYNIPYELLSKILLSKKS